MQNGNFEGNSELKIIDNNLLTLNGVIRLNSFNDKLFNLDTNHGPFTITGEKMELVGYDTSASTIRIRGKFTSFCYQGMKNENKESFVAKLFK